MCVYCLLFVHCAFAHGAFTAKPSSRLKHVMAISTRNGVHQRPAAACRPQAPPMIPLARAAVSSVRLGAVPGSRTDVTPSSWQNPSRAFGRPSDAEQLGGLAVR